MPSAATIWTDIGQWTGQAGTSSPEPFLSTRGLITDRRASYRPVPPTRRLSLRWVAILTSSWFFHDALCSFNAFWYFRRCCCKAGTQGYAGNTLLRKLMRRGSIIIRGPLYAPNAQQPVQEVRLLNLKIIQYLGRLWWWEIKGRVQILILGRYLKLSLPSLIYNKLFSYRLNGEGSVPIITEGTWPSPVWAWWDILLFCWWPAITRAHTCMLNGANMRTNLTGTSG